MADMYVKGGSLNPFWVDEDIDRCAKEEFKENMQYLSNQFRDSIKKVIDEFRDEINELNDDEDEDDEEEENDDIAAELEAKFQFIKRHSDNPDDLALAKKILGID